MLVTSVLLKKRGITGVAWAQKKDSDIPVGGHDQVSLIPTGRPNEAEVGLEFRPGLSLDSKSLAQ